MEGLATNDFFRSGRYKKEAAWIYGLLQQKGYDVGCLEGNMSAADKRLQIGWTEQSTATELFCCGGFFNRFWEARLWRIGCSRAFLAVLQARLGAPGCVRWVRHCGLLFRSSSEASCGDAVKDFQHEAC